MSSPSHVVLKQSMRTLVGSLLLTALIAIMCTLTLDFLQLGGNFAYIRERSLGDGIVLTGLGAFVVWLLILLVLAITWRLWLTTGIAFSATLLIGCINYQKLQLRNEPLYPSDWEMAAHPGFLVQMVGWKTVAFILVLLTLALGVSLLVGRIMQRPFPRLDRRRYPQFGMAFFVVRVTLVAVVVLALSYVSTFNAPGNKLRAAYEANGAFWTFWYQDLNYETNGFIGGALYNLNVPAMETPPEYDREEMHRLTQKYSVVAAEMNSDRTADGMDDVNVVFVLSEAFSDPTRLEGITASEDPIPYTRDLMMRTTSGQMLAHLFGGGTANMEFEALTGMSLREFAPQMNTPYQMLVPKFDEFPSVVGYLRSRGHRAIAVHPYMTSMYKRESVYPTLGFEEFISAETMLSKSKLENSHFIADESAFQEVEHQIKSSSEPLLINLVTMQNHWPMAGSYADPIPVAGTKNKEEREQSAGFARGLKYTDEAIEQFIKAIDSSPEKTIVVLYGDHLPAVWSEATQEENGPRTMRETPFFIYSNFSTDNEKLPTTSPIHFMNHVFKAADAAIPPYYALLAELETQIPAMEHGIMINANNQEISEDQLSDRARQVLRDYRLVQYDLSVGKRYSQAEMLYPSFRQVSR